MKRINVSTNTNENEGKVRIDDGYDTSLVGNGFIVESQTNSSVYKKFLQTASKLRDYQLYRLLQHWILKMK